MKFVPKFGQKALGRQVSQDMLDSTNGDPNFLDTVVTGDESLGYHP